MRECCFLADQSSQAMEQHLNWPGEADDSTKGLFESELDLDVRGDIEDAMGLTREDDDEYNPMEELESKAFRDKLDAGLCDKLFKDFRKEESTFWFPERKFYTVLLAVMVMESGAKISDDNMQHLREIVPSMESTPVYSSPFQEGGFCDPGRAQFLAALEHYKPGTPRAFGETR